MKRSSRGRRIGAGVCVALACISLVLASVGTWANRNMLETSVWSDRVETVASDPDVQAALARTITDEAMKLVEPEALLSSALPDRGQILVVPLTNAIEEFVQSEVQKVLASDAFISLFVNLTERAHGAAVAVLRGEDTTLAEAVGGRVVLDLTPILSIALDTISELTPDLFGRQVDIPDVSVDDVPADVRVRLEEALGVELGRDAGTITVFDTQYVEYAQDAVKAFDTFYVASIVATILFTGLALGLSLNRRRTGLQLLAGAALGVVLLRRAVFLVEDEIVDLVQQPDNAPAVQSVLDAFLDPFLTGTLWALAIFAVVALALVLTGPYRWAQDVRARIGSAAEMRHWLVEHRTETQVLSGVAFVLALLFLDVSWLWMLALLIVLAAVQIVAARPPGSSRGGPPPLEPAST